MKKGTVHFLALFVLPLDCPLIKIKLHPRRARLPAGVEGVERRHHGQRSRRMHDVIEGGVEEVRPRPRSTAGRVEVRMHAAPPLPAQLT